MKKLIVLTNSILEYRIPFFLKLAEKFDLTVAYYDKSVNIPLCNFQIIKITPKHIGPFTLIKESLRDIIERYDAAVVTGEMRNLSFILLAFFKKNYALTYWGGDVSFSYKKHYDEDRRLDKIRFFIFNKADSLVFYSKYPIHRYIEDGGINSKKLFVANNTVQVFKKIVIKENKSYFLFVGTLYEEKGLFDLLNAYYLYYKGNANPKKLFIIGDGPEKINIVNWVSQKDLIGFIILKGAIYEQSALMEFFSDAIACISPKQAGLSVLTSMGYGVPFVTSSNAITGGEIFNITNNVNGILYDGTITSLSKILMLLASNSEFAYNLGLNAQKYYYENATIDVMVKGIVDSVYYALDVHNRNS